MKIFSEHELGYTNTCDPLIKVGETTLEYRSLPPNQKEFVDAMREVKMIQILEEDPPAEVVPMPAPKPGNNDSMLAMKHRAPKGGAVMRFPEPTPAPTAVSPRSQLAATMRTRKRKNDQERANGEQDERSGSRGR